MKPILTPERAARATFAASHAFKVPALEILGRCRLAGIARARLAVYAALYHTCETSYPEMARYFKRDHTTILYGVRKAEARAQRDTSYAAALAQIAEAAANG